MHYTNYTTLHYIILHWFTLSTYVCIHADWNWRSQFLKWPDWDHLDWRYHSPHPARSEIIFSRMKKLASSWNRSWTDKFYPKNMEVLMDEQHNGLGSLSISGCSSQIIFNVIQVQRQWHIIRSYPIISYQHHHRPLFGCEDRGHFMAFWLIHGRWIAQTDEL